MIKGFEVTVCLECGKIIDTKETHDYEEISYKCEEQISYLETDLALHLHKIKPTLSICDNCAEKEGLITNGISR